MRLVPPDFTNRAGEPSLKPPTELETPSKSEQENDKPNGTPFTEEHHSHDDTGQRNEEQNANHNPVEEIEALYRRILRFCKCAWKRVEGWHNQIMALATIGIFFASVIYAGFSYLQWKATQKSADAAKTAADTASSQFILTRQQMIRTQAAKVKTILYFNAEPNEGKTARFAIEFRNYGHESASGVSGDFQVVAKDALSQKEIQAGSQPIRFTATSPHELVPIQDFELTFHQGNLNLYSTSYALPFSASLLRRIENVEVTVEVKGLVRYNNGFEDTTESVCFNYISYSIVKQRFFPHDFVPCQDFRSALAEAEKSKTEDQQQK